MNWLPLIIVSVQVTLVAALGLLAASLLRSAAHRHSVLLASLLCILGSPIFFAGVAGSGLSLNLAAVFPAPGEDAAAAPLPHDFAAVPQGDTIPALPEPEFPESGAPISPTPAVAPPSAPAEPLQKLLDQLDRLPLRADYVLAGLWLAGSLLSLAGVLRSQLKTQFILEAARPVGQGIDAGAIAETERRLGVVGHLRVATTGKVAGPAVIGILRPWILIPARYLEALSRDELLQVLIHEGAHALRRDPLVALLQRMGSAMFWWHPLIHLVNRNLTRAREEVCDNFVLTHVEPETYAATLLRLATLSPAMARLPVAIGMFDGRGTLEERIRGLLDSKRNILTHVRFVTAATVFGAFTILSVAVAATRVGAQDPGAAPPVAPAVTKKAARLALEEVRKAAEPDSKRDSSRVMLTAPRWGEPVDGVRARLSAEKQVFDAGEPIPITIEIENIGDQAKDYRVPLLAAPHKLSVVDENSRAAHPLLGLYQITVGPERVEKLELGRKLLLASFDLADSFYLRRPGRYSVRWQGEPAAATFEFEVVANPARAAADGDPIGRLLPLVKERWWLGAGPGGQVKLKPGSNWGETTGRMVTFVYNPPSSSKNAEHVWLWLAEKPAVAQPVDINSSAPATEYIGKMSRWHVYFLASESALKAWPTAKEEIKQALAAVPKVSKDPS